MSGVACHDTKLAGNYLMVAVLSKTGKVFCVACHYRELAGKSDK